MLGFYRLLFIFSMTLLLNAGENKMSIYDFNVLDIDGNKVEMSKYKGKVLLIVNVASECGFTPQYKGLQELYNTHKNEGFVVLGFPSNQFREQESASNEKIKMFILTCFLK